MPKKTIPHNRKTQRSSCPISCTLDILGDKWTLLIVRDVWMGYTRFKEFSAGPEGIPTNILSERLVRLVNSNITERVASADGSRHPAYQLTNKGKALIPTLESMIDWGLKWEDGASKKVAKR